MTIDADDQVADGPPPVVGHVNGQVRGRCTPWRPRYVLGWYGHEEVGIGIRGGLSCSSRFAWLATVADLPA